MTFSYFHRVRSKSSFADIPLELLAELTIEGLTKDECLEIRRLRKAGKRDEYIKLKAESLPVVTPHGTFNGSKLSPNEEDEIFKKNFKDYSGYLYFDFDFPEGTDVIEKKLSFVDAYRDHLSFACISSSMGGFGTIFQMNRKFSSQEEFKAARRWLIKTILSKEEKFIDDHCSNLNRFLFVSYDPAAFHNTDAVIHLPDFETLAEFKEAGRSFYVTSKKSETVPKQPVQAPEEETTKKSKKKKRKTYAYKEGEEPKKIEPVPLSHIENIEEILREDDETWKDNSFPLIFKSEVKMDDPWFVVRKEDVAELRITGKTIYKDTTKHKYYPSIISKLLYLNPLHPIEVFNYMRWINARHSSEPMIFKRLKDIFLNNYNLLREGQRYKAGVLEEKVIHFNNNANLSTGEKKEISGKINGAIRSRELCQRIKAGIAEMEEKKMKITVRAVTEYCGVCKSTAAKFLKNPCPDPVAVEKAIKEELNWKKGCFK